MDRNSSNHLLGSTSTLFCWFSVTVLWILGPTPFGVHAEAADIDKPLKPLARSIIHYCKEQGWKNVGVLNFRVKSGGKTRWQVGRLNTLMAVRLENALILQNDEIAPIGITRNAGEAAIQQLGEVDYTVPESCNDLLNKVKYPLAWGKEKVKVDAFLTGAVEVTEEYEVRVILEVFDAKNPKLRPLPVPLKGPSGIRQYRCKDPKYAKIACIKARADVDLLADLEVPFVLRSRKVSIGVKKGFLEFPGEDVPEPKKVSTPAQQHNLFPEDLDFRVYYGPPEHKKGKFKQVQMQRIKNENKLLTFKVPTPNTKERVHFTMRTNQKKLGVVVLVNGVNTLGEETLRSPANYSRWILEKDVTYTLDGFYTGDGGFQRFEVKSVKEAPNKLIDQTRLGKITLYIFRSGEEPSEKGTDGAYRTRRGTFADLKSALVAPVFKTRGVILGDDKLEQREIETTEFPNPRCYGGVTIRYINR
ncbi:MAG: hypothetical protein ACFCD0_29450 [Gemmataceae bacterium]